DGGERKVDELRDRLGDVLREDIPVVKSNYGWVDVSLVFGIEGKKGRDLDLESAKLPHEKEGHHHGSHEQEVDVLNVSLPVEGNGTLDWDWWKENVLESAQKDETFRIKGWGLVKEENG